jgi:anti-sigma-K factor RskA/putative zinc finger protein
MIEHISDELEAYALGALDPGAAQRVAAHLGTCGACRGEAARLAEVVALLPDTVPLRDPPGRLRELILSAASADRARPTARRSWSPGRLRPWPVAFAGLAAAAIVLGAADLAAYRQLTDTSAERDSLYETLEAVRQGGRWWYMAGRDSFAGSGGTLIDPRAEGRPPFVLFHDLPPMSAGKVLTIWLVSPDSTWARAGTFRPSGHDLQAVEINMEVAGFDRCAVTVEDSPWGPRYGAVVMESRITPPAP